MKMLKIHNWEKWQSYRKDRGAPPWIKVHRSLLRDLKWLQLSDEERGQLVSMWLLAAEYDGEIPCDPALVKKLCSMDNEPDFHKLFDNQLVDNLASSWRQHDALELRSRSRSRSRERKEATPPKEKQTADAAAGRRAKRTFKQWTRDDLVNSIEAANGDELLAESEVEDFTSYWMEPTATGQTRLSLERTWDTRRRMQTAVRLIFQRQRQNDARGAAISLRDKQRMEREAMAQELLRRKRNGTDIESVLMREKEASSARGLCQLGAEIPGPAGYGGRAVEIDG